MQNKEYLILSLIIFIAVFAVFGNMPSLLADEDNSTDDDLNETDDDENETEDEERDDSNKNGRGRNNRTGEFTFSKEVTAGNSGCVIKMERKIKYEDGKRVEEIKRTIECENGLKKEISIRIDNETRNGRIVEKIKYRAVNGSELEVEAEDEIDLEEETNGTEYRLKAKLRNGNFTNIKIMPDTASEIALERLKALNFTIQLRERTDRNVPRVVYNIEANKNGRFLGVFKLAMKASAEVDPETGELLEVNTPWWAFLVTGEDEEIPSDEGNQTDTNNTGTNDTFLENSTDLNNTNDTNNSAA